VVVGIGTEASWTMWLVGRAQGSLSTESELLRMTEICKKSPILPFFCNVVTLQLLSFHV
jgi:hypothetical protein